MSIGTDGKPARGRQHINSREPKAVHSKCGFDHWKGFGKAVFAKYYQGTVFQCAWGSRVYPQPVPAKESWGLFQSCTLTSSTLINHSTVGLVANHSAGTPVCWMGLFLEVDLPQEIGAICLKR